MQIREPDDPLEALRAAVREVVGAIFVVWSGVVNLLGVALALGLCLNVCGYGYVYHRDPPSLEVKRLEELRQENAEKRFLRKAQRIFPD